MSEVILSSTERTIIDLYRKLPKDKKQQAKRYLKKLVTEAEEAQKDEYDLKDLTEAVKEALIDIKEGRTQPAEKVLSELRKL